MPVFDFSSSSSSSKEQAKPVCTYTSFLSDAKEKTPEEPILVLDNTKRQWSHHASGMFANQSKRTAFEFNDTDGTWSADILRVDAQNICRPCSLRIVKLKRSPLTLLCNHTGRMM